MMIENEKLNRNTVCVTANISPVGPKEKCEVPTDRAYPVCAEKVEVRKCGSMNLMALCVHC